MNTILPRQARPQGGGHEGAIGTGPAALDRTMAGLPPGWRVGDCGTDQQLVDYLSKGRATDAALLPVQMGEVVLKQSAVLDRLGRAVTNRPHRGGLKCDGVFPTACKPRSSATEQYNYPARPACNRSSHSQSSNWTSPGFWQRCGRDIDKQAYLSRPRDAATPWTKTASTLQNWSRA
jgi:hypothetical protein